MPELTKEKPAKFHKFLKDDAKTNPKKAVTKKPAAKKAATKKAVTKKPAAKKAATKKAPVVNKTPEKPKTDTKAPAEKTGKGSGRGGKRENSGRKSLESKGLTCRRQIRAYVDDKTQEKIIAKFGSLKAWGHSLDKQFSK